jgi:aminoglycoside 6'-N-acetyltransferase
MRNLLNVIKLRTATIHDLETLERWDREPHVIESDPNDDWNWSVELNKFPPWREQLIAEVQGRPIGFIQIIDPREEESHYWGDCENHLRAIDIWIGEAEFLGQGYGTAMMELAIERCFVEPMVEAIMIDPLASNQRAIKFYERFGFKFIENRDFGQDFCSVMRLNKFEYRKR